MDQHSLQETQQQVSTIEGEVETIKGKVETIEGKVDNLGVRLGTIEAGLAKLLAADEARQKEKEMKEKAEQKDKENAEANTMQLAEAVRTIPTLLHNSGQVEKALRVTVPSAFPLSPSSAAPSAAPSAGLASSSSSRS